MSVERASAEQKLLAARLGQLAGQLAVGYRPANDAGHRFERTGWLMLRAAVLMVSGGDRAYRLAADWAARGYPAATDQSPTSSSDPLALTSVERAAIEPDEWDYRRERLAWLRRTLEDNATLVESDIADTIRVAPNEGRRSTLIDCANPHCRNVMTGLGDDRPRKGRCPRCYLYRYRTGRDWTSDTVDATTPNMQVTL